jgi:hypothetical protein
LFIEIMERSATALGRQSRSLPAQNDGRVKLLIFMGIH